MSVQQPKYMINGYLSEGAESDFLSRNRAFRLGDGFFETIRVVDGHIPFWEAHYKRLVATCKALRMELSPVLKSDFLLRSMQELISAQQIREGGRLRITIFREGGGAYTSDSNRAGYVAEIVSYFPNRFVIPDRGATLGTFTDFSKTPGKLSKFKLMGRLTFTWSQSNGLMPGQGVCPNANEVKRTIMASVVKFFMTVSALKKCIENGLK